ncbi:MAG: hypothetical protein HYU62_13580 [Caulobacterales bacterium]|nr:hypothetical protein [Caulobacterales bacterium]
MVRRCLLLAIFIAVVATLAIAMTHPHPDEALEMVAHPTTEDVLGYVVVAAMVIGGAGLHFLKRPAGWIERLALACALFGIGYAAFHLIRMEIELLRVFPKGGADQGWGPGQARAEFLTPWYWAAVAYLCAGALGAAVLFALSRLRLRSERS